MIETKQLKSADLVYARVMTFGAKWQSMIVPDKNRRLDDIVLKYDTAKENFARRQLFGIIFGHYANRIKDSKFTLDGRTLGKGNKIYRMGDGVALEAQKWPDSPNRPEFPSTRLDPGQTYSQTTIHHFYMKK